MTATLPKAMKSLIEADTCTTCGRRKGELAVNPGALTKKRGVKPEALRADELCKCQKHDPITADLLKRLQDSLGNADPYGCDAPDEGAKRSEGGGEGAAEPQGSPGADHTEQLRDTAATAGRSADESTSASPTPTPIEDLPAIEDVPPSVPTLVDRLRQLAAARGAAERTNAEAQERRKQFELDNAGVFAAVNVARDEVTKIEAEVRTAAEAVYKTSGERKPVDGVEVKEFTVLTYAAADALAWGIQAKMCISLDRGAFEKVAKASSLPFVKIDKEPRATIATNLAKHLPEATNG